MRYIVLILILILFINFKIPSQEDLFLQEVPEHIRQNSLQKLSLELNKLLNSDDLKNTQKSVTIYSIDNNEYFYLNNSDLPLTPASLTKLYTTYTALYLLGSDYFITTSIYIDGKVIDSILYGNLYIYGRGDALFSTTDLKLLIDKLYQKGLREIKGNIIADGSYFDTLTQRIDYSNDNDVVEPLPPITALSLERNTISVIVEGKNDSGNATVYSIPSSEHINISNKIKIIGDKSYLFKNQRKDNFEILDYKNFVGDSPRRRHSRSTVKVISTISDNGIQKFDCRGFIRNNRKEYFAYFAAEPLLLISGAVKKYLESGGIKVEGNAIVGNVPKNILTKSDFVNIKRPLYDLIYITIKESDNYLAENIYKIIGAYLGNHSSTAEQSRKIQDFIFNKSKIECNNCILNDGSGLSRRNLVTTRSVVQLLAKSQLLPFDDLFYNSLPIAGFDGTLKKRMLNSIAQYNVSAKTGTLKNVSGLAGFVYTIDGEFLAFAIIFNGPYVYNYKIYEDKIATLLASFSYN